MKGTLYEIQISESFLHQSHGMTTSIFEIYIPKAKVFINFKGIWKYHTGRYKNAKKIKKIDVPESVVNALKNYMGFKNEVEKITGDVLKNHTKGLETKYDIKEKGTVRKLSKKEIKKLELNVLKTKLRTTKKQTKKMNLRNYQIKVRKLAKKKGFDQELFYLFGRLVQEGGEMLDAIWQGKSDEEVGEEFADIEHFVFQMLDKRPKINPDEAMNKKIKSNYKIKKKTNKGGKMVRK